MKNTLQRLTLLAGLLSMGSAQATLWDIVDVLGCSSGFCASLFHSSSGSNPMSGTTLADITDVSGSTGAVNQYNDSTNSFDGGFVLNNDATETVRMTGTLSFGGDGLMDAASSLQMSFSGIAPLYSATTTLLDDGAEDGDTIFFDVGYQCCGASGFDPNTFLVSGSPFPIGGMVMTLWGANGWDGSGWPQSNLGIDLRVLLVENTTPPPDIETPEPASLALMALGLAGIGLRRFRVRA